MGQYRNLPQLVQETASQAKSELAKGNLEKATVLASLANSYALLVTAGQVSVYDAG